LFHAGWSLSFARTSERRRRMSKRGLRMGSIATVWRPADPLGEVLHLLRMRGAFYSHTEASAPWSLEMPAIADSLSFHVVTAGSCVVTLEEDDPVSLRAGDLALVPHGRGHVLSSEPGLAATGRVDLVPQHYLTDNYSLLRYGGDGEQTTIVCGIVSFDDPAARALMRILPTVIHVDAMAAAGHAINDTIRLLSAELGDLRPGGEAVTIRLTDVLVIQAIRSWLDRSDAAQSGWLGALQDPRIGQALRAVHRQPGRDWTLTTLAREAGMSRSSFAAHFAELVGEPPMAYVTRWRMQVARTKLEAGATVSQVATSLGYRSEAAFTRAFARVDGTTPGAVRRERLGS
jgi:AraC-like DNA-binding protein